MAAIIILVVAPLVAVVFGWPGFILLVVVIMLAGLLSERIRSSAWRSPRPSVDEQAVEQLLVERRVRELRGVEGRAQDRKMDELLKSGYRFGGGQE